MKPPLNENHGKNNVIGISLFHYFLSVVYKMSGMPLRSPLDADKFRREYLNILSLQTKNDDKNYAANRLFKQTGVPQQPTDTRTFDEKMRDIEGLKQSIRGDLTAVMDSTQANKVVQSLANDDIVYLGSRIDDIIGHTQRKWTKGVNADIFINLLREYARAESDVFGISEGVQNTSRLLTSTESILSTMVSKEDLDELKQDIGVLRTGDARTRRLLIDNISALADLIPSPKVLEGLMSVRDAKTRLDIQQLLSDALQDIPKRLDLETIMKAVETASSAQQLDVALRRLNDIVATSGGISGELENIKLLIADNQSQIQTGGGGYIPPGVWGGLNKVQLSAYIDTISTFPRGKELLRAIGGKSTVMTTRARMISFLTEKDDEIRTAFSSAGTVAIPVIATPVKSDGGGETLFEGVAEEEDDGDEKVAGSGIRGRGVGRPRTRNYVGSTRPKRSDNLTKEDIDYTAGVSYVSPRFVPLGRYVINKGQLDKNIVSIKTKSGGCICGFKSQRTSAKMGSVIRKIIGGGVPTFDEIAELDTNEKTYLHKVASASGIIDKLNIPAPDKSAEDKEIDQFELMKGQILSGNDNREYIKKFKLLVMKLSKGGMLPMRQAKEVLYELAMLGY